MDKTGLEERLKKVSQGATRGNVGSIEELMKIATELYEEKNFNLAAETFKDAAVCYRIEAFRRKTKAEDIERKLDSKNEGSAYLKDWVKHSEEYKNFDPSRNCPDVDIDLLEMRDLVFDIFDNPDFHDLERQLRNGFRKYGSGVFHKAISVWVLGVLSSSTMSYKGIIPYGPYTKTYERIEKDLVFGVALRQLIEIVKSKLSGLESNQSD